MFSVHLNKRVKSVENKITEKKIISAATYHRMSEILKTFLSWKIWKFLKTILLETDTCILVYFYMYTLCLNVQMFRTVSNSHSKFKILKIGLTNISDFVSYNFSVPWKIYKTTQPLCQLQCFLYQNLAIYLDRGVQWSAELQCVWTINHMLQSHLSDSWAKRCSLTLANVELSVAPLRVRILNQMLQSNMCIPKTNVAL